MYLAEASSRFIGPVMIRPDSRGHMNFAPGVAVSAARRSGRLVEIEEIDSDGSRIQSSREGKGGGLMEVNLLLAVKSRRFPTFHCPAPNVALISIPSECCQTSTILANSIPFTSVVSTADPACFDGRSVTRLSRRLAGH